MAAEPAVRAEVHYAGHVQGVGFRYTVHSIARDYHVTGYVQNLADGRVRLVAEGPQEEVDHLIAAVNQRMEGCIDHQDRRNSPSRAEFADFTIRR